MDIFLNQNDDSTVLSITVSDDSYRYRAIKGDHNLTLFFSLPQHVEIPVGAYCVFEAETYTLEAPENFKMHNSRNFEYTVIFESSQSKAKKYKFRNPIDRRLKFTLTDTPRAHLQMFIDNMNMRDRGWTIGQCIDAQAKSISYNHSFCINALSQQAKEFETEYEFNGKTVSLRKIEYNKTNPLPLSYGKGNGFKPGVGRTNFNDSKPVEVLFVQGGDKNIDPSKYNGKSELLLPKNQTLRYDGKCLEGQAGFNTSIARTYISDADGLSIQRQDKPLRSKEEDSLDLSNIYPSRVGEVTKVEVTKEGFCDFFDTTIPSNLDFSKPESRFNGETMTVIFQSGMLSGKEFEIQQNDNRVIGYIHSERRFKVVEQMIDGCAMPKGSYMPKVGDKYAVFGISLPDAYVCNNSTKSGASWEMFKEAAKYLYDNEEQKFTFTGELDGTWAKKDWLNIGGRIKLGGYVLFRDPQFQPDGVGIRIVGIKDYINNPHSPEIELSNAVVGSSIMSDIQKIESNEVFTDSQHKGALQFTKRRFRDSIETMEMLSSALLENYTSSINPISVRTMQLLIGDESLQFRFVIGKDNPITVPHTVVYNAQSKVLTVPAGTIQHLTLGIDSISAHKPDAYNYWDIPTFNTAPLIEADKKYYLYVKVSTSTQTGEYRISETAIEMNEVNGHYHLLMGVLNSQHGENRSYVSLYGFTEILPGRITTDKIVSSDGNTYFDLVGNEIGGKINFKDGLMAGRIDIGESNDTVSAFVNGTKTELDGSAFSAGISNFGTTSENRVIDLKHQGYGSSIGVFKVREDGIYIDNGEYRTFLTNKSIAEVSPVNEIKSNTYVRIPYTNMPYNDYNLYLDGKIKWADLITWESESSTTEIVIDGIVVSIYATAQRLMRTSPVSYDDYETYPPDELYPDFGVENYQQYIGDCAVVKKIHYRGYLEGTFYIKFIRKRNGVSTKILEQSVKYNNREIIENKDPNYITNGVWRDIVSASMFGKTPDDYKGVLKRDLDSSFPNKAGAFFSYGSSTTNIEILTGATITDPSLQLSKGDVLSIEYGIGGSLIEYSDWAIYKKGSADPRIEVGECNAKIKCTSSMPYISLCRDGVLMGNANDRTVIKQRKVGNVWKTSISGNFANATQATTGELYKDASGFIKVK